MYPHFKRVLGFPPWFLPEQAINRVCEQLGEDGLLELALPSGACGRGETYLGQIPPPETVPDQIWEDGVNEWQPHGQVKPVVEACLQARDTIMRRLDKGGIDFELAQVCGSLAVLALVSFLPASPGLLTKLAEVFETAEPCVMLTRYAQAVVEGQADIVNEVHSCISEDSVWTTFASLFCRYAATFPFTPKVVAVTPPLSTEVANVLISMIKEADDDKLGASTSGDHGDQIGAQ